MSLDVLTACSGPEPQTIVDIHAYIRTYEFIVCGNRAHIHSVVKVKDIYTHIHTYIRTYIHTVSEIDREMKRSKHRGIYICIYILYAIYILYIYVIYIEREMDIAA